MSGSFLPLVLPVAGLLAAACQPDGQAGTAKVAPPDRACICARACGLTVVANSHWVDAAGTARDLGFCPAIRDEILYDARAGCQCPTPPSGAGGSPNH